ncbi:hypothetical protein YDYSY3_10920 [Paenibacillus chitinolyticus]|uniref:sensor histidine kinase n=1 Tax=Paenibacillus chitinolyticus TaxID=79263 RepID=UPI0026E4DDDF|nr:sensor histidine kinase [Paenibacillus chitinolyticus]GKS10092.1 hypothetical protein YDYSY3_10920 [Paenibacillus chitinolyticus]
MNHYPFRPKARTMLLLGEELIKDDLTAITELVKNSYDADATLIQLEINNTKNGYITLTDNGHGMTSDTVIKGWLELATSFKTERVNGAKKRSPVYGRVLLGEKGVGRFACHRLAEHLKITTRGAAHFETKSEIKDGRERIVVVPVPDINENAVIIDWNKFNDLDKYLDEVKIPFTTYEPNIFKSNTGTILSMTGLKAKWDNEKIKDLNKVLVRLMYPFGDKPEVEIRLVVDGENVELDYGVYDYVNRSDIKIKGTITRDGRFIGTYNGKNKNEILPKYERIINGNEAACYDFEVEFNIFERNNLTSLRKSNPLIETITAEYGGVAIYRDGFRVLPYGEKGVDWLNLDERRISKISTRIGNKQLQGLVSISSDLNSKLQDKTNREGLIENDAYFDFKELIMRLIKFIENERITEKTVISKKVNENEFINKVDSLSKTIFEKPLNKIDGSTKIFAKEIETDIKDLKQLYFKEMSLKQNRMENLTQLSGLGIAAERSTHEIGHLLNRIKFTIDKLLKLLPDASSEKELVYTIQKYNQALDSEIKLLNPLFKATRLTKSKINIKDVFNKTTMFFKNSIKENGIKLEVIEKSPLELTDNEGVLIQVFINLLDNAIYWTGENSKNDQNLIVFEINGSENYITISDSGPGVHPEDIDSIFEPLFSKKINGRGLGLFITEEVLSSRGHKISYQPSSDGKIGACFKIEFNIKGELKNDK